MRDRVAQAAAKIVLEPIFEADFLVVLVWVSAETVGDDGQGAAAPRVHRGPVSSWWSSISPISSARSTTTGYSSEVGRRVSDRRVLKLLR